MRNDHELLITKLDGFIRKYYQDRLVKGALYTAGLLALFFLGIAVSEYFGRFGTGIRTVLFWGYLACTVAVLIRFIAIPIIKWLRLGPVISHDEAARIIGAHFSDVKDKLLNTLQLRRQAGTTTAGRELIEASIAQRTAELGPIAFTQAIDLRKNTRYLRYALPPVLVLLLLLIAAPSVITGPTQRLIRHGSEFIPEAPFRFVVQNADLSVPEQEDFELLVSLEGDVVPQQLDLVMDGRTIPMVKDGASRYKHRFRNVQQALDFRMTTEGINSGTYTLNTVPNPTLLGLELTLEHPAYLDMPDEKVRSTGDVKVPAGTRITWNIGTRSAEALALAFDDTTYALEPVSVDRFIAARRFTSSNTYRMIPRNGVREQSAPLTYRVEVVPDLFPAVEMEERVDTVALKRRYFHGAIGDDHGFSRLMFHHRFVAGGDSVAAAQREGSTELVIDKKNLRQEFFHSWDLYDHALQPGDRIEYWFEVWDNDGVNGPKRTRSRTAVFEAPSLKELNQQKQENSEAIERSLKDGIREAQELQRDLDRMRREMLDKKELDWQDKQKMQNILDRQQQLQERIEKTTEQLRSSQQQQQEFRKMDQNILDKQEQLQELFENVLSEEMKELYRQVQEMMEKLNKDDLQEQVEEMKLSQEDIEKELDRTLELFKQMEVEQQAMDIAEQLEELAKEQEALSEESKQGDTPKEELEKKQDELSKEFQELRKEMDELQKKNEELETPMDLPKTDEEEEEIQKEQEESSEELEKNNKQKAGEKQQSAAEQMEQLAHQMKSSMQAGQQEQQEEDMDALRQLLENIVQLSFDQEGLMDDMAATSTKDPRFIEQGREQKNLRDDARVIEDSLFALSKRVPQLHGIVNREMNAVNGNMDEALEHVSEARANDRHKPMAAENQQRAMTSLNNLALLLDEALEQMMQQKANNIPGSGSCDKPGGSGSGKGKKPSMAKMKKQQEALQKQLEEMRKAMGEKKGKQDGDKNSGGKMPGMSKELAQLAAQQAAIRKEMQRLAQELNKDGSGSGNGLNKLAEEMEKNEKDIVNKRIDQQTIDRQKDIMVRLLEAEKAERERELDIKRTSNEGRQIPPPDPAKYFEYHQRKTREAELLRTVPAGLKPYYQERVNEYFGTFDRP